MVGSTSLKPASMINGTLRIFFKSCANFSLSGRPWSRITRSAPLPFNAPIASSDDSAEMQMYPRDRSDKVRLCSVFGSLETHKIAYTSHLALGRCGIILPAPPDDEPIPRTLYRIQLRH